MIKKDQKRFYAEVGRQLTEARKQRNLSITQLRDLTGEQYKTIQAIESGHACSLHHLTWLCDYIDLEKILEAGSSIEQEGITGNFDVDDFI